MVKVGDILRPSNWSHSQISILEHEILDHVRTVSFYPAFILFINTPLFQFLQEVRFITLQPLQGSLLMPP